MSFHSKDSESRMRPKYSARVPTPTPSTPKARGPTRKPPTPIPPSPYLTTTQLMAKIRNSATTSVSEQISKVIEARNQASSKAKVATGSGRPQSKSSREFPDITGLVGKDSSTQDFNRDRSRIFAKFSPLDTTNSARPYDSLKMTNTTLTSPFCPKKASSVRRIKKKPVAKPKEDTVGQNLPEVMDKSKECPQPHQVKNLGMGDPPVVCELDSTDSKETIAAGPSKSILKMSTHRANEGFGPKKLKNRIFLSDEDMHTYESASWKNGFTARRVISPRSKSDKKVRFVEQVTIHPVPYEARGSTEWQHNLLLSREMMLQRFLSDPRLGLFPDIFGTKSHPVASMHEAFDLNPKPKPPSTNSTRPPRSTPRYPRNF